MKKLFENEKFLNVDHHSSSSKSKASRALMHLFVKTSKHKCSKDELREILGKRNIPKHKLLADLYEQRNRFGMGKNQTSGFKKSLEWRLDVSWETRAAPFSGNVHPTPTITMKMDPLVFQTDMAALNRMGEALDRSLKAANAPEIRKMRKKKT